MYLLLRSFDKFKSINGSNEWRNFKQLKLISKIRYSKLLRKKIKKISKKEKETLPRRKICYALLFLKFSRRFESYSLKKKNPQNVKAQTFLQLSFQS